MTAGARLLFTVRCPACGNLPDGLISVSQAMCGNPDCDALLFDPTQRADVQMAAPHVVGPLVDESRPPGVELPVPDRPAQQVGSAADVEHEAWVRARFHQFGYVCADGLCPVCGPHVNDGE